MTENVMTWVALIIASFVITSTQFKIIDWFTKK